jgi:hypothetical protein
MKRKSIGTPLFEATLSFVLPDNTSVAFPALWGPTGSVIPQFSAEEFAVVGKKLKAMGRKNHSMTANITLVEDTSVRADIAWDDTYGFAPEGEALAHWVRARYPDDCAYLDEVPYPATVYWRTPDGSVMRMPAHWLNTGEVRLRPPEKQLHEVMELRHAATPEQGCLGHVVLCADSTIAAAIHLDEDYSLMARSLAFSQWMQSKI